MVNQLDEHGVDGTTHVSCTTVLCIALPCLSPYEEENLESQNNLPEVTDSVMFRLFRERPKDWREEEEDVVLDESDGGRVGLAVFPVSAFSRSFSAFRISISFWFM